jgi:hypothetical protein
MSNLKQIGLGFMQYAQDYDERYPASFTKLLPPANTRRISYFAAVDSYLKNKQLWICPSEAAREPVATVFQYGTWGSTDSVHYYYNYQFGGNDADATSTFRLPLSSILTPSEVFLLWDMHASGDGTSGATLEAAGFPGMVSATFFDRDGMRPGLKDGTPKSRRGRHLEGDNYAYADGHVKWLARKSVPLVKFEVTSRYFLLNPPTVDTATGLTNDIRFVVH